MNYTQCSTQQIRNLLCSVIGETTAKTYFSYYGLFKDGLMFGLYKDNKFYLKLAPQDICEAISYQGIIPLSDPNISHSDKFFLLPQFILDNLSKYLAWFKNSLNEIQLNKYKSYYKRKETIRSLPNMTFRLEKFLKRINIHSIEDLRARGEINIFVDLMKIGLEVNHITLFKLYGAINHQFIYTIPPHIQKELLLEANEALYAAGFRRIFKIRDE